jgi:S1-C subfamily serine protease
MQRKWMVLLLAFLFLGLNGCMYWDFEFQFTTGTYSLTTSTLPTVVNGTLTIGSNDYNNYQLFHSSTYDLTDVSAYNDVLLETRDKIRRANVQIVTTIYRTSPFFPYSTILDSSMAGSGVIYRQDESYYYILTNEHVINNKGKTASYEVKTFGSDTSLIAELLAYDENLDLAVLRIAKTTTTDIHLIDVTSRVFKKFNAGELVLAVGNPLSVINNVTFGEFLSMETISNATFKVIYHNATIHEGSSGGALVDIDGNFLGINTWGSSQTDEQAFAVPNYIVYMFLINHDLL